MLKSFLPSLRGKTIQEAGLFSDKVIILFTDDTEVEIESLSVYNSWKGQVRISGGAMSVDEPEQI